MVLTIHSPSTEIFGIIDKLILLSEGRNAYVGNAKDALNYFASIHLLCD